MRRPTPSLFEPALILGYALMLLAGLLRHEPWRDEAQAWLIAVESDGLGQVLARLTSEGHPPGWYLLLWVISRFTHDPLAMQLVHGTIAIGSVALIALASPFTRLQKLLLALSYYSLFEYGMISRAYALGVLGLYGAVALYGRCLKTPRPGPHAAGIAGLLLLAGSTSVYGFLLAVGLGAGMVCDHELRRRHRSGGQRRLAWPTLVVGAAGLVLLAGALAWSGTGSGAGAGLRSHLAISPAATPGVLGNFVDALLHLPLVFAPDFWTNSVLRMAAWPWATGLLAAVAAVWVLAITAALLRRPAAAVSFGLGVLLMLLFAVAVYRGYYVRHFGHYFILTVVSLWLFAIAQPTRRLPPAWLDPLHTPAGRRRARAVCTTVLACSAAVGLFAWAQDLARPFSHATQLAAVIRSGPHPASATVLTDTRAEGSAVAAQLQRPIYFTRIRDHAGSMDWPMWARHDRNGTLAQAMQRLAADGQLTPPIYLITRPGPPPTGPGYRLVPLQLAPPPIAGPDQLHLYRVQLLTPQAPPHPGPATTP
jgi:hypothetical protein